MRIRILPENLTNKIAAGEVVERPASVVKELVENALDAGGSDITVEIEGGGKRLIRVTDNGFGMTREDALLALERHATSKIATDADLFNLTTLGFRGEALPSMASVSRFVLATRQAERIEGTEIYAEGGRIKEVKECGMAVGTVVTVRNLFFNTPARLKFMKSNETEAGHVGDLLTRLAVSRPDIRFTYLNDGKTVFRALPGDLRSRVVQLLGRALAAELHPVQFEDAGVKVSGLAARPECSRSAAGHLYTYINGRFIRDRVVQHAVLQAYRSFLERGRYPVVALFIDVPPGEVDVNVHPTKHEVRFREQGRVHDIIMAAVEGALRDTPWLQAGRNATAFSSSPAPASPPAAARIEEVREALARYRPATSQQSFPLPAVAGSRQSDMFAEPAPKPITAPPVTEVDAEAAQAGYFSSLAVIGQFHAAYILCQDGDSLVLIDQHAAHERVAFERLKTQFAAGQVESQGLLFPETVELSFREAALVKENLSYLNQLGFVLEEFGGATWLLKGAPRLLGGGGAHRPLRDILEELQGIGRSRVFADALEDILARLACHSVVRGAQQLDLPQIRALFSQMDATGFASNCPHGRPVLRKITLAEIEKMFKRG